MALFNVRLPQVLTLNLENAKVRLSIAVKVSSISETIVGHPWFYQHRQFIKR